MRKFRYLMNCTHSTRKVITEMTDRAKEITWVTFRRHVPVDEVRRVFPFYSYRREYRSPITGEVTAPMHIKDDYAVSFWKGKYRGKPCYYICHSGIEYIFTT